jgi:hypothetical protein
MKAIGWFLLVTPLLLLLAGMIAARGWGALLAVGVGCVFAASVAYGLKLILEC